MMKQYTKALRETVALSLCRHSETGGWVMEDYFIYSRGDTMVCQYIVTRKIKLLTKHEHDGDGFNISDEQVEINLAEPITCLESGCGAWQDGRCQYNARE